MTVQVVAGDALAITGTALIGIAAVGLLRLPDVYNRANAVSKAAALGVACVLLGTLVLILTPASAAILGLAVILQLLTTPFGAYAAARAAYRSRAPFSAGTRREDLHGRTGSDRASRPEL
ncbi:MAG: cation:proton antiporter [Micromonosporaceae bacterium]